MSRALVFDCDGVLADTENDGHRIAFNAIFAERGIPVEWTPEQYAELVKIGGGKERMRHFFTPQSRVEYGLPADEEEFTSLIVEMHKAKTATYRGLVDAGALTARPGVRRLVAEALDRRWKVAVASTSASESVLSVLRSVVGDELAGRVEVFAGDIVSAKKPAPDIYLYAMERLGVVPSEVVVVEDSGIGCAAAVAAGLFTIVTVSTFTSDDDFDGAVVVLSDLGEPGFPSQVLRTSNHPAPKELVNVDYLEQILMACS